MATLVSVPAADHPEALRAYARNAAQKILSKDKQDLPADPRDPVFASEYIRECDRLLANTPPLLQEAIESAGHAAEGANVDPFQGVVEVLQNAEDRSARAVRIMLREKRSGKQMLISHDGLPVEYQHVLAMMLPFVSTKRDDPDLRGRFGIGLKTLRRICTDIEVHGSPYHFGSGSAVSIVERPPEPAVAGFYEPEKDTLLVLDLEQDFAPASFESWFEAWSDDGLIFLDHIRLFELQRQDGSCSARSTKASAWIDLPLDTSELERLQRRTVTAGTRRYLVHRGHVRVPPDQQRFHKRTAALTSISVATAGVEEDHAIFVGLRTRIPTSLPFALDAQFDPVSSREGIQENKWNTWLLKQAGTVIAHAAINALARSPRMAWHLLPVGSEGVRDERWPAQALAAAFETARTSFADLARFGPGHDRRIAETAYEDSILSRLLTEEDIQALAPDRLPLPHDLRDRHGRWRTVLDALGRSRRIGPADLISGMASETFAAKSSAWWVEAAATLVGACAPEEIFGAELWLCEDGRRVACQPMDMSDRKIVFGAPLPALAEKHRLFDVLHSDFGSASGKSAIDWLARNAAFTVEVDAQDELLAFATAFENGPIQLSAEELKGLRDLLDPLSGQRAQRIGERVGRAVLIEAVEAMTKGRRSWRRPCDVYLPKAIDKDSPHWPHAAWGVAGIFWAHPSYDEGLRTGLGKRRKREDGTRSRGARNFLALLGAMSGPRLEVGAYEGFGSESRRRSMARAQASRLKTDIRSSDLDRVLSRITDRRAPKKERRERAVALLRSLSREWSRRLQDQCSVEGEHKARVYTHLRGRHDARWLDRLKETAWIPVGRDRFRKPAEAALRTDDTQAIYKAEDLVAGIRADELDEDFVEAIGLTARVRAEDLLTMLEEMRDGRQAFDAGRAFHAYQHFARLIPKGTWVSSVGDIPIALFRQRFAGGEGLVLVDTGNSTVEWRRPDQVRRGKRVLPDSSLYVSDRDSLRSLWTALRIGGTTVEDCCDYLKSHAARFDPSAEQGAVIQIYRHLATLLSDLETAPAACRHIPLACHGGWRARRPIYLVADSLLRDRLAAALPDHHFWQPPCDTRSIAPLVEALAVQSVTPQVRAIPDERAREQGEDEKATFEAAVDHLSNALGKRDASLRQALKLPWKALRSAQLYVYDRDVPVDVTAPQLGGTVRIGVQAHVQMEPLELHVASDALELRDGAGAAIARLFDSTSLFSFDAEWVLAWQTGKREVAEAIRFSIDDDAHRTKVEQTAARIGKKGSGPVKLNPRGKKAEPKPPAPAPRELKDFQPGISSVEIVEGKPPGDPKGPVKPRLKKRASPSGTPSGEPVANTNYTNVQLEDFAWQVLTHVLDRADGTELEDFRRRHGVGADGAFDWSEFVELKATGRSMQSSVSFQPSEFKRALERGNDYILALVHNCEKGSDTGIKLIFDPARRTSLRETEAVRLNGLADAPGLNIKLDPDGGMASSEEVDPEPLR